MICDSGQTWCGGTSGRQGHQVLLVGKVCNGAKFIRGTLRKTMLERHSGQTTRGTMLKSAASTKLAAGAESRQWIVQGLTKTLLT